MREVGFLLFIYNTIKIILYTSNAKEEAVFRRTGVAVSRYYYLAR